MREFGEVALVDRMFFDADEMQSRFRRRTLEMTLRDHCEVEAGAESQFAYRKRAAARGEAFSEVLRRDEDPLHLCGAVRRVVDVAELLRKRLVADPAQPSRNHRSTGRFGSWIHSL